jgi:hypothetical protein
MRSWSSIVLLAAVTLAGCSQGFDRGRMDTALKLGRPTYVSGKLTVEQIEQLKPQVQLPIRLAVSPPFASYSFRWGTPSQSWSADELAEIESWQEPLRNAGVVKELIVLPTQLVEPCKTEEPGCMVAANRAAAARVQADALLMISLATDLDEYANPLSVLDVTIVGAWLAPGHHRDALTIAEGSMIDNRNEYLYLFARGEGQATLARPLAYASRDTPIRASRLLALQSFGRELVRHASNLRTP